jgi:hypothetical protein
MSVNHIPLPQSEKQQDWREYQANQSVRNKDDTEYDDNETH